MPFGLVFGIKDYIIAGLAALLLALCVMCFVAIHLPFGIKIEGFKPKADRLQTELATANDRLKVSNASIDTLTATIKQMNAEADARAKAYQDGQQEAAREAQANAAKARASQGQIDRLRALASQGKSGCAAPKELNDNLEGL